MTSDRETMSSNTKSDVAENAKAPTCRACGGVGRILAGGTLGLVVTRPCPDCTRVGEDEHCAEALRLRDERIDQLQAELRTLRAQRATGQDRRGTVDEARSTVDAQQCMTPECSVMVRPPYRLCVDCDERGRMHEAHAGVGPRGERGTNEAPSRKCRKDCTCLCHDTGGGVHDHHGRPCPGKYAPRTDKALPLTTGDRERAATWLRKHALDGDLFAESLHALLDEARRAERDLDTTTKESWYAAGIADGRSANAMPHVADRDGMNHDPWEVADALDAMGDRADEATGETLHDYADVVRGLAQRCSETARIPQCMSCEAMLPTAVVLCEECAGKESP